ncbi:hypothetical protein XELAEV_18001898mg [Xenopus laevis]|uniref:Secreted protein n=1 Tax=Xenopus laevis TaxID=8355 RepID=A0A974BP35_XENLA|nr:hypothetical protein XELAEV_18001898mg [Xenopus laevis]
MLLISAMFLAFRQAQLLVLMRVLATPTCSRGGARIPGGEERCLESHDATEKREESPSHHAQRGRTFILTQ